MNTEHTQFSTYTTPDVKVSAVFIRSHILENSIGEFEPGSTSEGEMGGN